MHNEKGQGGGSVETRQFKENYEKTVGFFVEFKNKEFCGKLTRIPIVNVVSFFCKNVTIVCIY